MHFFFVTQDDGRKEVTLHAGHKIKLTTDEAFKEKCTAETVYLDYKNLPKVLEVGKRVYIDDGLISVSPIPCLFPFIKMALVSVMTPVLLQPLLKHIIVLALGACQGN